MNFIIGDKVAIEVKAGKRRSKRDGQDLRALQEEGTIKIAELELSALSRLCWARRFGSIEEFDREIQALVKELNKLRIKVQWPFSLTPAREKLSRHYEKVNAKN